MYCKLYNLSQYLIALVSCHGDEAAICKVLGVDNCRFLLG